MSLTSCHCSTPQRSSLCVRRIITAAYKSVKLSVAEEQRPPYIPPGRQTLCRRKDRSGRRLRTLRRDRDNQLLALANHLGLASRPLLDHPLARRQCNLRLQSRLFFFQRLDLGAEHSGVPLQSTRIAHPPREVPQDEYPDHTQDRQTDVRELGSLAQGASQRNAILPGACGCCKRQQDSCPLLQAPGACSSQSKSSPTRLGLPMPKGGFEPPRA